MPRFPFFSSCLMVLSLSACSEILNLQSSGSSPGGPGPIPGPPPGDSVASAGAVTYNTGNITIVSTTGPQSAVSLRPRQLSRVPQNYLLNFAGVKLRIEETPILAIDTFDTQGRQACGLEIAGGEFRLVSGNGTHVIGTYTPNADTHYVLMRLSRPSHSCAVSIRQVQQGQGPDTPQTVPPINATAPFIDADFGALEEMRYTWNNPQPNRAENYFIGNVIISAGN